MDNKANLRRIKTIIAVSVAALLLCIAAAAGYALFSTENTADSTADNSTTSTVNYAESAVSSKHQSGANIINTTTQKSSTKINGTALSTKHSHSNTAANTAQKPPTSNAQKPEHTNNTNATQTTLQSRCQIEIICKTAAEYAKNHPSVVLSDKAASGKILQSTAVEISDGDTAFDVLKRVCSENNIALEFTKTPLYNSYYIEGIGGLYEFDCGSSSGWIYAVNGERPNSSCSEYKLIDGDKITFAYTCKNGADV